MAKNKIKKKPGPKNKGGRPTVMTKETIRKLEEVFAIGGSDSEACFYAGISKESLYAYCREHPEFTDRKESLKEKPILKARQTVVKSLDQPDYAFKYLERKKKDEFSPRQELTGKDGESIKTSYEIKLNEIREEYGNKGDKCSKGTRKNI